MLLMRCAWHPKYHGYPWLYGVRSWRGASLSFSDGMCGSCVKQWRAEFHSGRVRLDDRPPVLPQLVPGWAPRVGLGIALATAVVFAASPLDLRGPGDGRLPMKDPYKDFRKRCPRPLTRICRQTSRARTSGRADVEPPVGSARRSRSSAAPSQQGRSPPAAP